MPTKKITIMFSTQGWHSGESTRLPPTWPEFGSSSQHHMCVEFVVGSLLAPRGFSLGTPGFPLSKKPQHFQIPIRSGMVDEEPLCGSTTTKSLFIFYSSIYLFIYLCIYLTLLSVSDKLTNLLPMVVAECRLRGRGIILWIAGLDHVSVSANTRKAKFKHHCNIQVR